MSKQRLYRTLEYSARVARLSPAGKRKVEAALLSDDRRWADSESEPLAEYLRIIGGWIDPARGWAGRLLALLSVSTGTV
jgi:hypothetical protein